MQKLDWSIIDIGGIRALKRAMATNPNETETARLQAVLDGDIAKYHSIMIDLEQRWFNYVDEIELQDFYDAVIYAYLLAGGHMPGMDIEYYEQKYYRID